MRWIQLCGRLSMDGYSFLCSSKLAIQKGKMTLNWAKSNAVNM